MKKHILSIFVPLILIAGLVSCSNKAPETTIPENPVRETMNTAETPEGDSSDALAENLREVNLSLPVKDHDGWMLPGTLTLPEGDGPFPAVVLVHGSGPNDRDETIYENKPFKDLAQNLAQKGIAVYRYDKRTYVYGKDMAADMSLTLDEETVIDAAAAVSLLKSREDIDSDRVFVLGHSLGGQAIPRIHAALASAENRAAGYIFLAAPARNLAEIPREQYDFLYSFNPVLTNTQKAQKEEIYAQLDRLDNVSALDDSEVLMGAYAFYWKDLLAYDPVSSASEITEPCFVLQGEEDYQVTMTDFSLWQDTFGNSKNWSFRSYTGLTHLFMPGERANGNAVYLKKQTVDARVIADIAEFINTH